MHLSASIHMHSCCCLTVWLAKHVACFDAERVCANKAHVLCLLLMHMWLSKHFASYSPAGEREVAKKIDCMCCHVDIHYRVSVRGINAGNGCYPQFTELASRHISFARQARRDWWQFVN